MKRFLAFLLLATMLLSLCACDTKAVADTSNKQKEESVASKIEDEVEGTNDVSTPASPSEADGIVISDVDDDSSYFVIETGDVPGAKLMDATVPTDDGTYDLSTPASVDEETGYTTFELPVKIKESALSSRYEGIGEFDDHDEFLKVWTPYAEGLIEGVKHDGLMTDVVIYGQEAEGDHLFGNDADNIHSYSLVAQHNGYQSVTYSFMIFVDLETESWDRYDYSEFIDFLNYYTGIELTAGDLYNMQAIVANNLITGVDRWTAEVVSSETDNYDNFRVTGGKFMDGVECWQFYGERMISKWADLYDREALRNGNIEASTSNQ